jgi:hypothetical protein
MPLPCLPRRGPPRPLAAPRPNRMLWTSEALKEAEAKPARGQREPRGAPARVVGSLVEFSPRSDFAVRPSPLPLDPPVTARSSTAYARSSTDSR